MKLNGHALYDCVTSEESVRFIADCTMEEALAMSGTTLTVTDDNDEPVAAFSGYTVTTIEIDRSTTLGDRTMFIASRQLDDSTKAVIKGIETNMTTILGNLARTEEFQNDVDERVENLGQAVVASGNETAVALAELGVVSANAAQQAEETMQAVAELGVLVAGITG